MRTLAAIQREFLANLADAGARRDARMQVHRRNAEANWHDALAAAYPVVARLVGPAFFREAALRYAEAEPSASGDLEEFGAAFAPFLAAYPHAATLAYLADVARLEWALHESERAGDAAPLDLAALARCAAGDPGAIRLRLHPAVRLIASPHPILAIWEANQAGRDGSPEDAPGAARVLVRRVGGVALPAAIDAFDWTLLAALAAGETLDQACVALGEAAAEHLGPALARHVRDGVLCDFEAPGRA